MSNCIKKVFSFEEFLCSSKFRDISDKKLICVLYHKLAKKPHGRCFEVDLYAARKEARMVDYSKIKEIKNEIYLFPQEYGIILLGAYDDNYDYTPLNYYLGEFYDMLTDRQKIELHQSQGTMRPDEPDVIKSDK